ncbi:sensor histidine kinase [Catellatospora sichuanensis]|uniref:sensor histidine kinase n=1 Tax=Catellatospora sichuanensis TaxID=1969805 RepID=UPI001182B7BC|nr:histidine kinase [Catellatospora sichuanensis]
MTVLDRLRAAAARRPHADIAIAVVIYTVTLVTTAAGPAGAPVDPHGLTLATFTCGALAARSYRPFLVLLVTTVGAESYLLHYHDHHGQMVLAAPLVALYTVAEFSHRRRPLIVGGLVMAVFGGIHLLVRPATWIGAENIALGALGALAVAAGTASRHRRAWLAEAQAAAAHAEADREAEAARRVTEERLRIARELHDALGHHLALIHVQAGVAAHVLDQRADVPLPRQQAREAVAHIATASRTALADLADTVGLLRQPDDLTPAVQPATGLDGINDLLRAFERLGLTITEHTLGTPRPVPAAADLTAYRIVQESLTNVCKHAGPVAVVVRWTYLPQTLHVTVDNAAGRQLPEPGARGGEGHGLTGMRERVGALGGAFTSGPLPDGGFRITAALPLAAGAPA